MIRINRPKQIPSVLAKKGASERRLQAAAFAKGMNTFEFDTRIYGHRSVKAALVKAQHEKCCFCESRVTHVASGHIEHFRPKGGVRQQPEDAREKPGYFWLAYDWLNLLFCCEVCNSRFKKDLFPLANPRARARSPDDDLTKERPMFIDPSVDDPALHLGFREEYPFAVNGSRRGEATWKALGLDREELAEVRRDHLAMVRALRKVRDGNGAPADRAEAAALLERLASEKGQWSAMVRAGITNT